MHACDLFGLLRRSLSPVWGSAARSPLCTIRYKWMKCRLQHLRSPQAWHRRRQEFLEWQREEQQKKEQREAAKAVINRYQHIDCHKVPGEKVYTLLTKQKVYSALIDQFGYAHPAVTDRWDCGEVLNSKPMLQHGYGFVE